MKEAIIDFIGTTRQILNKWVAGLEPGLECNTQRLRTHWVRHLISKTLEETQSRCCNGIHMLEHRQKNTNKVEDFMQQDKYPKDNCLIHEFINKTSDELVLNISNSYALYSSYKKHMSSDIDFMKTLYDKGTYQILQDDQLVMRKLLSINAYKIFKLLLIIITKRKEMPVTREGRRLIAWAIIYSDALTKDEDRLIYDEKYYRIYMTHLLTDVSLQDIIEYVRRVDRPPRAYVNTKSNSGLDRCSQKTAKKILEILDRYDSSRYELRIYPSHRIFSVERILKLVEGCVEMKNPTEPEWTTPIRIATKERNTMHNIMKFANKIMEEYAYLKCSHIIKNIKRGVLLKLEGGNMNFSIAVIDGGPIINIMTIIDLPMFRVINDRPSEDMEALEMNVRRMMKYNGNAYKDLIVARKRQVYISGFREGDEIKDVSHVSALGIHDLILINRVELTDFIESVTQTLVDLVDKICLFGGDAGDKMNTTLYRIDMIYRILKNLSGIITNEIYQNICLSEDKTKNRAEKLISTYDKHDSQHDLITRNYHLIL